MATLRRGNPPQHEKYGLAPIADPNSDDAQSTPLTEGQAYNNMCDELERMFGNEAEDSKAEVVKYQREVGERGARVMQPTPTQSTCVNMQRGQQRSCILTHAPKTNVHKRALLLEYLPRSRTQHAARTHA